MFIPRLAYHDVIVRPVVRHLVVECRVMYVLHIHIVKHVVHIGESDRSVVQQRFNGIEVVLVGGLDVIEVGGVVESGVARCEGRTRCEPFEGDLFGGFDRSIRVVSSCQG